MRIKYLIPFLAALAVFYWRPLLQASISTLQELNQWDMERKQSFQHLLERIKP